MNAPLTKYLLVGVAMLLAAWAALALKPVRNAEAGAQINLEDALPKSFDSWTIDPGVVPVTPSPDVQANLERLYAQVVSRTYVNSRGERVMLTVAYGGDQSDALKAHRQEVCYQAQGFQIRGLSRGVMQLEGGGIPVTRMLALRAQRSEPVTYWFTMGDQVVIGRLERFLVQLQNGLSGRVLDGMLVRVSSIDTDSERAFQAQEAFVAALLNKMEPDAVTRLVGAQKRVGPT